MKKIRLKNSFTVYYTVSIVSGNTSQSIDLNDVQNLSIKLKSNNSTITPYKNNISIGEDGRLRVHIEGKQQCEIGVYRIVVSFDYENENYKRDPIILELVPHVECEKNCTSDCDCIEVETVNIVDTVNTCTVSWGQIQGDIYDQKDLIDLIESIPGGESKLYVFDERLDLNMDRTTVKEESYTNLVNAINNNYTIIWVTDRGPKVIVTSYYMDNVSLRLQGDLHLFIIINNLIIRSISIGTDLSYSETDAELPTIAQINNILSTGVFYNADNNIEIRSNTKILGTESTTGIEDVMLWLATYMIDGVAYLQLEIGSKHIHLNLNTNNDTIYGIHITVDTPKGKKILVYSDEVYSKDEIDDRIDNIESEIDSKANISDIYTKQESDSRYIPFSGNSSLNPITGPLFINTDNGIVFIDKNDGSNELASLKYNTNENTVSLSEINEIGESGIDIGIPTNVLHNGSVNVKASNFAWSNDGGVTFRRVLVNGLNNDPITIGTTSFAVSTSNELGTAALNLVAGSASISANLFNAVLSNGVSIQTSTGNISLSTTNGIATYNGNEIATKVDLSEYVLMSVLPQTLQSPADESQVIRTSTDIQVNAHKLTLTDGVYVESDENIIVPSADPTHAGAYPADHYNKVSQLPVNMDTLMQDINNSLDNIQQYNINQVIQQSQIALTNNVSTEIIQLESTKTGIQEIEFIANMSATPTGILTALTSDACFAQYTVSINVNGVSQLTNMNNIPRCGNDSSTVVIHKAYLTLNESDIVSIFITANEAGISIPANTNTRLIIKG